MKLGMTRGTSILMAAAPSPHKGLRSPLMLPSWLPNPGLLWPMPTGPRVWMLPQSRQRGQSSPLPAPTQGLVMQKLNESGNSNTLHKHSSSHHKKGPRHNPNAAPPFPVPVHYHQQPLPTIFHAMVQPHIPASGYAYQPYAGPIPSVRNHMVKSGFETPVQNFVQPVQSQPRSNPNAYGVNFSTRRPNMQEPGGPWNHTWHQQ